MFFVSLLESNFKCKSLFQEIIYLSSTKSTTNELWTYYNNNPKKYLVITDNQTAGKGRGINSWFSVAHKSIVCSFIIEQLFSIKKFNFHSLIIPLSIIKGIKKYLSIDLKIKWPNDIMFENKKVAGILIESKKISDKYILNIGIGININENISDFNDEIKNSATSLKIIKGHNVQREPLLACILNELYHIIKNYSINQIKNEWLNSCNHINKNINFKYNKKNISGNFLDISNNGQAILEVESTEQLVNYDGEIKFS